MDNHEPDHLRIERYVLEDKNCSTRQVGSFPESEGRLSTSSQRSNVKGEKYQAVGNIQNIQEKGNVSAHDVNVVSGAYDLQIHRSPVTSASGQCNVQEESTRLFNREILNTQEDGEDSNDSEATAERGYFLKRQELQFKRHSVQNPEQIHSIPGESAPTFHRDVLDTQIVNGRSRHNIETTENESYFLANHELEFECLSGADGRRKTKKPNSTQTFATSKQKLNRGSKQNKDPGIDGEYWRRMFLTKDDVTSLESSLEQGLPETKRQWYRSKKLKPGYSRSRPNTNLDFWFILLALIMTIIVIILNILLWKYLLGILF